MVAVYNVAGTAAMNLEQQRDTIIDIAAPTWCAERTRVRIGRARGDDRAASDLDLLRTWSPTAPF
jgi:hypothetical protein